MKFTNGWYLPETDTHFQHHLENGPVYNQRSTYQYKKFRAAMDCIPDNRRNIALDIGAHVGLWSFMLSYQFNEVEAFEPGNENVECFQKNLEGFDNVHLRDYAVSNAPATLPIKPVDENSGNTRIGYRLEPHAPDDVQAYTTDGDGTIVRAVSLDTDFTVYHASMIDFIKIDVEGWETPVVHGAEYLIRVFKPYVLVEQKPGNAERYGFKRYEALELLKSFGMVELWEKSGDHFLGWP